MQQQYPQGPYTTNPYASPSAAGQYTPSQAGYEFGPQENEVFSGAGGWMLFTGIVQLVGGILALIGTVAAYINASERVSRLRSYSSYSRYGYSSSEPRDNSVAILIGGLLATALIMGLAALTIRAASGFRAVATTNGNDIPNVMSAMRNLRALYRTIGITIIVYFGLVIVGVMLLIPRGNF